MEVILSKDDSALYSRLYISRSDIQFSRQCATYLLKKGWHHKPWERRHTIYFQQSAFTSALATAYMRPFTQSHGWPKFPSQLVNFTPAQQRLHQKLLRLRHEVYAHSASVRYNIRPFRGGGDFPIEILSEPFLLITATEAKRLLKMADKLIAAIDKRLDQICPRGTPKP